MNELFDDNKDDLLQTICSPIDLRKVYHINDIKNIMSTAYTEFGINKKPTLKDIKALFKVRFLSNREYIMILDYKWSN